MALTVDSKLGDLFATPELTAIVDKYVPGSSTNPLLSKGKKMKISLLLKMPQSAEMGFTQEAVDKILADANQL